jgi:hypothetical protein
VIVFFIPLFSMNRVRLFPTLFSGIICLLILACSENSSTNNRTTNAFDTEEHAENLYPAFERFPKKQFKSLCLGESKNNLEKQMENMPVEVMAEEEDSYFYFPADSSEMILPFGTSLNEFKVFLKGKSYLENSGDFCTFLSEKATDSVLDAAFPVYYFETDRIHFKMTYFKQATFIRLHFILL